MLSALRRQGAPYSLTASELAAASDLSGGAMTNRIDRLEARGLVRRLADETDRRIVNVRLTGAGKKLIDDAIQHRLEAAKASLASIAASDQRRLAGLLRSVMLSTPALI